MRDYVTTVFNLIVGLINADKLVYLALIGLGVILVWQLLSLLANFHRRFAGKCRKISKFLTTNGLTANNYNNFLALVAKMPQEFIRGYKTFEHASYGLPSDYIKRFDSIDVEVNGGLLNHGKSLVKAVIYGWTIILAVLSLALLGNDTAITGFAIADALIVPVLFLILAKVIYFIFNAIKQQQYKVAIDEFNEMLDIMDDKIENNDSLPGPDVLTDLMDSVPIVENSEKPQELPLEMEQPKLVEDIQTVAEDLYEVENDNTTQISAQQEAFIVNDIETIEEPYKTEEMVESTEQNVEEEYLEEDSAESVAEYIEQPLEETSLNKEESEVVDHTSVEEDLQGEVYTEEQLIEEVDEPIETVIQQDYSEFESLEKVDTAEPIEVVKESTLNILEIEPTNVEPEVEAEIIDNSTTTEENVEEQDTLQQNISAEEEINLILKERIKEQSKTKKKTQEQTDKGEEMEEKRGRGRPKKVPEGELVITNDKQFEEVLQRAEKLMRKSEEALSSSQAKRVEKSLKELIDAMTKYKEEH